MKTAICSYGMHNQLSHCANLTYYTICQVTVQSQNSLNIQGTNFRIRDSSVSIVTRLLAGRAGVRIRGGQHFFYRLQQVQTSSGTHQASGYQRHSRETIVQLRLNGLRSMNRDFTSTFALKIACGDFLALQPVG